MSEPLILIPARMASTRFPGKPLAMIAGKPMICHVIDRANEAGIGQPVVATDADEIADAVRAHGGEAVMTGDHHQSGSDRIWEAACRIDPQGTADIIINLQGDFPTVPGPLIAASAGPLTEDACDIGTIAVEIEQEREKTDPNVVKAVGSPLTASRMRALYFTRAAAPAGDGPLYHHIGIYAYRRAALERFINLPPSPLELRERLEQLRALEAGMRIDVEIVEATPLGVDTPADLERAERLLAEH